jgi:hypothetical protein
MHDDVQHVMLGTWRPLAVFYTGAAESVDIATHTQLPLSCFATSQSRTLYHDSSSELDAIFP